jgi:site-specific recombinase XerD
LINGANRTLVEKRLSVKTRPVSEKGENKCQLLRHWEQWLKDAKIENFHWHDLRYTFASRLVMAGIDLYVVKELLGHHSIEMTQHYAHLGPKHLKQAVEALVSPAQLPSELPIAVSSA